MKYYLLLLFFSLSISGFAQKMHRHYSFYPQEGGNVYFIHPQKGFKSEDKTAVKDLIYDITYLSEHDSASFTFTYSLRDVMQIHTVEITDPNGQSIYTSEAQMLYVQPRKSAWQHRASIRIPYALLEQLYRHDQPYVLTLIGGRTFRYQIKPGPWKKQAGMMSRIFDVVKYNQ